MRRALIIILGLLVALVAAFVGLQLLLLADNRLHGPYVTWYNAECQRLADEAHLVGRPEAEIVAVLGPPSFVYDLDSEPGVVRRTYNYAAAGIPFSKFQVHCRDGIVAGLEQFDD
ncbi:hypothetical protein OJF2_41480 [Aquisphaera giovannonii]|uniref:Uncharacterized protein n=1 Tax=Aquisphaera giovannonii TaxID=406548 RepID=A0A5B9W647_9BACT|nr:hypothetical protein [Aquisphaera giovannonii]QEH35595.1 hypothetical protein OJF2_41480 [Aquisphaera giovannonii]